MSESLSQAQSPSSGFSTASHSYQLSDDLARLCLPREWKDSCRTLAWVNSVCCLFLAVGLVGLKPQKVIHRPLKEATEISAQIFTPPEEVPKNEPDVKQDIPDEPQDNPQDTPQVVTVIAAADPSSVAFAVPVQGAVAVSAAAHLATPPPLVTHVPSGPIKFTQNTSDGGSYPSPRYPSLAARNHEEGTVLVEIMVDQNGTITSSKIQRTSGHSSLDEAALDVVKSRWRFPPGQQRWLSWSCTFRLE